jgi:hypothetical protein
MAPLASEEAQSPAHEEPPPPPPTKKRASRRPSRRSCLPQEHTGKSVPVPPSPPPPCASVWLSCRGRRRRPGRPRAVWPARKQPRSGRPAWRRAGRGIGSRTQSHATAAASAQRPGRTHNDRADVMAGSAHTMRQTLNPKHVGGVATGPAARATNNARGCTKKTSAGRASHNATQEP